MIYKRHPKFYPSAAKRTFRPMCNGCLQGLHDKCKSVECPCPCCDSESFRSIEMQVRIRNFVDSRIR